MSTETTTTTPTIAELKAALALAEQKWHEEKRAIEQAERDAKYEAARLITLANEKAAMLRWEAAAKAIVVELKIVGFKNAFYEMPDNGKYPKIRCFTNGSYPSLSIAFEESYTRNYGHGRETKIKVGQYGDGNTYPQLKAGGFNYRKIASTAWEKYQNTVAKQMREDTIAENRASNKKRIENLATAFGEFAYKGADYREIENVKLSDYILYSSGQHSTYSYRSDNDLKLDITHITEEDAAKLLKFMSENGMLSKK